LKTSFSQLFLFCGRINIFVNRQAAHNRRKYLAAKKRSYFNVRVSMGKSIDDPATAISVAPQMWPNKMLDKQIQTVTKPI